MGASHRKLTRRIGAAGAVLLVTVAIALPAGAAVMGRWTVTGGAIQPGRSSVVTALTTPDGQRVLAAGGVGDGDYVSDAYLYDPGAGEWTPTTDMHRARIEGRSVLLDDGRVLIVGGDTYTYTDSTYEIYDPTTATWSVPRQMPVKHDAASVVKLSDGRVLIAAGTNAFQGDRAMTTEALVFDPATDSVTPTGSMMDPRFDAFSVLLRDGRVLVTGGCCGGWSYASTEIYDPSDGTWTQAASMNRPRHAQEDGNRPQLLADGRILVVGGGPERSAEIYDPATDSWTMTGDLPTPEQTSTVVTLRDGTVLTTSHTAAVHLFDPLTGAWTSGPDMDPLTAWATGTVLDDGRLLLAGGDAGGGDGSVTLLYTEPGSAAIDKGPAAPPSGRPIPGPACENRPRGCK